MILRRLTANFRRQDWTAVVVELLIVVLGVFIGLQVNNWNEARIDRALEQQYIQRLHDDFALSIKHAESNIANMQAQFVLEGKMVDRLRECRLDAGQRADFAKGIYRVGRFQPPTLIRGTTDELQSTGRRRPPRKSSATSSRAQLHRLLTSMPEPSFCNRRWASVIPALPLSRPYSIF